ncbi:MAG TPA: DUF2079 domain-containing protein [Ktedonobacterales bacterium]|nr:DUF2079 domain-containing protein [Ktedonobacterales bacterium]
MTTPLECTPPKLPSLVSAKAVTIERSRQVWQALRTGEGQLRLSWALLALLVIVDIVLVCQHSVARYQTYHADAFDLGNMNQAVWNTLHGHLFRFTNRGLDWFGPPTRLGIHVEPILLLIAPLYLIHDGPETLIVVQNVALALGAIPLFMLGLRRLPTLPLVAVAFAASYLLAPEFFGSALWDFHSVALATPLLILSIWALDAGRYRMFIVAAVLAALTKEDVALSLALLGLLIIVWRRRPYFGLAVIVLSVAYTVFCFAVVLPHFNGGISGGNNFWYRYSWLGGSAGAALKNILRNPLLPFTILDGNRLNYLGMLLRTGGGLGIFMPALWLCALPELAVNVLSAHIEQYSGFFQYNAVILAYVMPASVYGVATLLAARQRVERGEPSPRLRRPTETTRRARLIWLARRVAWGWRWLLEHIPVASRWIPLIVVAWLLVTGWWNLTTTAGGIVGSFWHAGDHPLPQQTAVNALLDRVPQSASVAATDSLNPRLSSRYTVYLMPDPQSYLADYVAVDISSAISVSQADDRQMFGIMLQSGRYEIVGRAGNVTLLHRIGAPVAPAG